MNKSILALIFGALLVPGAQGSVMTYTTRADYESALTTPTTYDFNQPDGPISGLGSLLTITTIGWDANGQVHDNALCGSSSGAIDCFPQVLFTFQQPSFAFGFDNLDLTPNEEVVFTVFFSNGDPQLEFVFDLGGAPAFTPIFFGVTSTNQLSGVATYSRDIGSPLIGDRANIVDNITLDAASSVPERDRGF